MALDVIPRDQQFFLLSQACAFIFARWYRKIDDGDRNANWTEVLDESDFAWRRNRRLLLLAIPGVCIGYLCYGSQFSHLLLLATLSYLLLRIVSARWIHIVSFVVAMTHLGYLHYARLVEPTKHNTTISTIDITAPVMVMMQKVTSLAFNLYDGMHREAVERAQRDANRKNRAEEMRDVEVEMRNYVKLSDDQRTFAVRRIPSALEYAAYMFHFPTVICGPLVFYRDFVHFIDSEKLRRIGYSRYPSAIWTTMFKLAITIMCGFCIVFFAPLYPSTLLLDSSFSSKSLLSKIILLYLVTLAARLKYYFAWTFSEMICDEAGLGYNGLDPKSGTHRWNLMNNVDIWAFENSFSQRDALLAWNKTTETWLRRVAYDRAPLKCKLLLTYILSAVWHGFHPGYYLTFISGALFTQASRSARRTLRPHFQSLSPPMFTFYHLLTWLTTRIAMAYLAFPFVLLELGSSLRVASDLHYFGHLTAVFMIVALPFLFKPSYQYADHIHRRMAQPQQRTRPQQRSKINGKYIPAMSAEVSSTEQYEDLAAAKMEEEVEGEENYHQNQRISQRQRQQVAKYPDNNDDDREDIFDFDNRQEDERKQQREVERQQKFERRKRELELADIRRRVLMQQRAEHRAMVGAIQGTMSQGMSKYGTT